VTHIKHQTLILSLQGQRIYTSGFTFGDALHLRTSTSIRVPNFAKIAQSAAEILLLLYQRSLRWWN